MLNFCKITFKSREEFTDYLENLSLKSFNGSSEDYYRFTDLAYSVGDILFPILNPTSVVNMQAEMPDLVLIDDKLSGLDPSQSSFKKNPNFAAAQYL